MSFRPLGKRINRHNTLTEEDAHADRRRGSWIEGGTGLKGSSPVDAATICAPQAATCGKGSKAIAATFGQLNLAANPTEQDWQGHALSGLGAAIKRTHTIKVPKKWQKFNPNVGGALDPFVGVFYLSTTTQKNSPVSLFLTSR